MTTKEETSLFIFPECRRATDELVEVWGVEVDIIDECYRQRVELRGIDPGHKFLQVFDHPFELKNRESREHRANWRKWTWAFEVRVRLRGFEDEMKFFEAGQTGVASGHRLG
jgi:hypothetical protein